MTLPDNSVFVVTYHSPYPEDGGGVDIIGVASTEHGALMLAIDRVRAVGPNSPISDLDHYRFERQVLKP